MDNAVKLDYTPRPAFVPFHQRSKRWAVMVCHRRAGKTVACVHELVIRALYTKKKNAKYAYVGPFRQQTKEVAWSYLKDATDGIRVGPPRESELRVKLPNGATITLYGADNPDSLRGLFFDGIILDEFGDIRPSLLGEVILPTLADRKGWMAIIGTAKGRGQFRDIYNRSKIDDDWFGFMLKASESGIIDDEELAQLKANMGEDEYRQEMECDFDAAIQGAYYANIINRLEEAGQIKVDPDLYDEDQKVFVAADIGRKDSTSFWFWQPRLDGFAIIDHYRAHGEDIEHYLDMLLNRKYDYEEIWLPWDSRAKTLATKRSVVEQFYEPHLAAPHLFPKGLKLPIKISPKLDVNDGIAAARLILPQCHFDLAKTMDGVDSLRSYQRRFNEKTGAFDDKPLHNWASDDADAFRYLALVCKLQREASQPPAADFDFDRPKIQLAPLWEERERAKRFNKLRI